MPISVFLVLGVASTGSSLLNAAWGQYTFFPLSAIIFMLTLVLGFTWIGSIGTMSIFGIYRIFHRRYISGVFYTVIGILFVAISIFLSMVV